MSTPFQAQGTLGLPGAPGLPLFHIPFGFASSYSSKVEFDLDLVGQGVRPVSLYGWNPLKNVQAQEEGGTSALFGVDTPPGAKCILVIYDYVAGAPEIGIALVSDTDRPDMISPFDPGGGMIQALESPREVPYKASSVKLSTGGFLFLGSPSPERGVTTMLIEHADSCRVRVLLLG